MIRLQLAKVNHGKGSRNSSLCIFARFLLAIFSLFATTSLKDIDSILRKALIFFLFPVRLTGMDAFSDNFKSFRDLEGTMMKYLIPLAVFLMLAIPSWATMWLYDDPTFFQMGYKDNSAFRPANVSLLEIVGSPYFPLLGQGFYKDAIPVHITNSSNIIQIGSKGRMAVSPIPVTFGGHLEDNLRYAQTRSSLRVGQGGTWNTLSSPGALWRPQIQRIVVPDSIKFLFDQPFFANSSDWVRRNF